MDISLKQYWDLLASYIRPQRVRFSGLAVLLLSSIGLQIVNPQIMRYFIDTATSGQATGTPIVAALAFIGIASFQQAVSVGAAYVGENVAWSATNALRVDLVRHCLKLDMSFHNEHSPGELIERIDGDVAQLSNFFSRLVIHVIGNLLLLLGILCVLFLEDWRLGLAFTLFAALTLCALGRVRDLVTPYEKALRQAHADLFGFLEERLAGAEDLRSSGAVDFGLYGLYKRHHVILRHQLESHNHYLVVGCVSDMSLVLGNVMAILAGYYLFQRHAITIGTAYLLVHYVDLLGRPIRGLSYQIENMQSVGASTERLEALRRLKGKIQDGPGADLPAGPLSLAFDDVSFGYVPGEPVLKDLSFRLEPGTVLGLLGRTGSGKTTLARLVFRLYDPAAGRITLGDVDTRAAKLHALRQRVAIVTQEVQLFQASVRDNLTFFDRNVPDERVHAIIEELGLADWYQTLPDGLDTQLETDGRGLSAGEAQLLALARVFLRDPGLVILDEASSRLDPATEQRLERAVDKLLGAPRRSAIIIAHRLSTIQRADSIMILEAGRVVERGMREQLASDPNSRFYGLLQTGLDVREPCSNDVCTRAGESNEEVLL
ncbi:MAG: ABC transporter ATP-binding protein [Anaerolineae bacterium]|jgi:ATP-binding cassette subfamily B protein